jgi:hypothetical protein
MHVPSQNLQLPLQINGILSYLPAHCPKEEELNTYAWVILTTHAEWDPKCGSFKEKERQ